MNLGTCDARVRSLTLEWHELNSNNTQTACHLHQDSDGDGGDGDDDWREHSGADDADGRHHCGIIHVNPATGLAQLWKLKYDKTYTFTATAHTVQPVQTLAAPAIPANLVLANFTVRLPGNSSPAALVFVNLLRLSRLAPAATCDCIGSFCPPAAKFLPLQSVLPPVTMKPGELASVSLKFANCYDTTDFPVGDRIWADTGGYFLKARPTYATDLTTWGFGRVPLPYNNPCYIGPCAVVNPGEMVSFDFTVAAPMIPTKANPLDSDKYEFIWGIRKETGAIQLWIDNPSTTAYRSVVKDPTPQQVFLCGPPGCTKPPCQTGVDIPVDPTGNTPSAAGLQQCIDRTPIGGTLELPVGIYKMDRQMVINHPMTLRTAGIPTTNTDGCWSPYPTVTPCAVLYADDNYMVSFGFLSVATNDNSGTVLTDVVLDHLILNGNKVNRLQNQTATDNCKAQWSWGWNASGNCKHCTLQNIASVNALCGTGYWWEGNRATIVGSVFRENGIHDLVNTSNLGLWADGLSLVHSDGGHVDGNYFANNTDVDFIMGGNSETQQPGTPSILQSTVQNNTILHDRPGQASFVALMLNNWGETFGSMPAGMNRFSVPTGTTSACYPYCGNFTRTTISGNTIDCGANLCDYGIEAGFQPWASANGLPNNTYPNIFGGFVTRNAITGAKQGINLDGAGSTPYGANGVTYLNDYYPITVYANTVIPAPPSPFLEQAAFFCFGPQINMPISAVNIGQRGSSGTSSFYTCPDGTLPAQDGNLVCRGGETNNTPYPTNNWSSFCP